MTILKKNELDFPSIEVWNSFTKVKLSSSKEFKALDQAFLNYSNVRGKSYDVTKEFKALKEAYALYEKKKKNNLGNYHLFGTTNRDTNEILSCLKDFLGGDGLTDDSDNRDAINYTFERLLRAKTILAGTKVQMKKSRFEKTKNFLVSLTINTGWPFTTKKLTFIEQLKLDSFNLEKKYNDQSTNVSAITETVAGNVIKAKSVVNNIQAVKVSFHSSVAQTLKLDVSDPTFLKMMAEAQKLIGDKAFDEVLGFVPYINTAANVVNCFINIEKAITSKNDSVLCGRFKALVAAPGDATAAFTALEEILNRQSNKYTQAYQLNAVSALTILDPSGITSAVNKAAQAVLHRYQEVLGFGVDYYQMIAANEILDSWENTPLNAGVDPSHAVLAGLKHVSVGNFNRSGTNDDKFKARRAFGGMTNTHFTGAMRESPLLACYFLSKSVPADLQAIVAADLALNMGKHFFQTVFLSNLKVCEDLIKKAKKILEESRFEVQEIGINNSYEVAKKIESQYYSDFNDRGKKIKSAMSSVILKNHAEQSTRRKDFEDTMPIISRLLLARMKLENDAQQLLTYTLKPVEDSELIDICKAINSAVDQYNRETSGVHRIHTWRNDESIEAMNFLSNLATKKDLLSLRKLEAAVFFLVSQKEKPAGLDLKPLKEHSRLKKLLSERIKSIN